MKTATILIVLICCASVTPLLGAEKVPLGFTAIDLEQARGSLPAALPVPIKHGFVVKSVEFEGAMERWGLRPGDVVILVGTKPVSEKSFREWYASAVINRAYAIAYMRMGASRLSYVRHVVRGMIFEWPIGWRGAAAYDAFPERLRAQCLAFWTDELTAEREGILDLLDEISIRRSGFIKRRFPPFEASFWTDQVRLRKAAGPPAKRPIVDPVPGGGRWGAVIGEMRRCDQYRNIGWHRDIDNATRALDHALRQLDDLRKNDPPFLRLVGINLPPHDPPLPYELQVGKVGRVNHWQMHVLHKISDRSALLAPYLPKGVAAANAYFGLYYDTVRYRVLDFDFSKYADGDLVGLKAHLFGDDGGIFEVVDQSLDTKGDQPVATYVLRPVHLAPPVAWSTH
jgi:hypothetical protein